MANAVASPSYTVRVPTTVRPDRPSAACSDSQAARSPGPTRCHEPRSRCPLRVRRRRVCRTIDRAVRGIQIVEQPVDAVAIPGLQPQRVGPGVRQRHGFDQIGQLAVENDTGQVVPQRITDFSADRFDIVDQALQRAVFDDPLRRGLLPTPGMPGRLSLGSPRSAAKSGYCFGVNPYFSTTASG